MLAPELKSAVRALIGGSVQVSACLAIIDN